MAGDTRNAKLMQATGKSKTAGVKSAAVVSGSNKTVVAAAKQAKKDPSSDSNLLAGVGTARQFLKEVAVEFNKITWPGRAQVIQETYSVLFLVTVITLMVLSFDWFLGKMIFGPLEYWARLHGGGVGRG